MVLSRYLKLIPLDTQALRGKRPIFKGKISEMRGSPFSVLWKSMCFSGCLGGVPMRSSSCHLFLGDGRRAEAVGRAAWRGPFAREGPGRVAAVLGPRWALAGVPSHTRPAQLPPLFPVPWAVAQQAVNISWWCRRAKLVKSESLSLYIIPTEKLPRRPYSSLSPGKPSTDTQWLLFSCHQRTLLFKKKNKTLFNRIFHTYTHKSRDLHTEAHIPFTQLQSVFMFCQSRFFSVVLPPLFLVVFFFFFCWKIFKQISGFP